MVVVGAFNASPLPPGPGRARSAWAVCTAVACATLCLQWHRAPVAWSFRLLLALSCVVRQGRMVWCGVVNPGVLLPSTSPPRRCLSLKMQQEGSSLLVHPAHGSILGVWDTREHHGQTRNSFKTTPEERTCVEKSHGPWSTQLEWTVRVCVWMFHGCMETLYTV